MKTIIETEYYTETFFRKIWKKCPDCDSNDIYEDECSECYNLVTCCNECGWTNDDCQNDF